MGVEPRHFSHLSVHPQHFRGAKFVKSVTPKVFIPFYSNCKDRVSCDKGSIRFIRLHMFHLLLSPVHLCFFVSEGALDGYRCAACTPGK